MQKRQSIQADASFCNLSIYLDLAATEYNPLWQTTSEGIDTPSIEPDTKASTSTSNFDSPSIQIFATLRLHLDVPSLQVEVVCAENLQGFMLMVLGSRWPILLQVKVADSTTRRGGRCYCRRLYIVLQAPVTFLGDGSPKKFRNPYDLTRCSLSEERSILGALEQIVQMSDKTNGSSRASCSVELGMLGNPRVV